MERWIFARAVAKGLDLCVTSPVEVRDAACVLEVFNLGGSIMDFADGVRRMLAGLNVGSVITFPPALDAVRREVVTEIATELGLLPHEFADVAEPYLAVGNLSDFESRVRHQLSALQPGEEASFGPCCGVTDGSSDTTDSSTPGGDPSPFVLRIVHSVAEEFGLPVVGDIQDGARIVTVKCPGSQKQEDEVVENDVEESVEERIDKLFNVYAQCIHGKVKLLRRPNLLQFVEDACRLRNKKTPDEVMEDIERVFDDTLELSVDMGSRQVHGLTREYFQIFLQKSVRYLGWSLLGLLTALNKFFDQ
eukprot:TRINITY_DN38130_c0_g2_i1.p1 TRINITY_DN38130_c0_g2~~TRINITY_DN38130_c0_g2_i1.p1  ORF type:complete len:317 (+),score=68.28 TRINITY_DN38130_c0_g2_i1:39-953(+)